MKKLFFILNAFVTIMLIVSCSNKKEIKENEFPLKNRIHKFDSVNRPMDSTSFYFPLEWFDYSRFGLAQLEKEIKEKTLDTNHSIEEHINVLKRLDTTIVKEASQTLYRFQEPILSAKYLGDDTYRVFIIQSGPGPISIRMTLKDDKVKTIVKFGAFEERLGVTPNLLKTNIVQQSNSVWDTLNILARSVNYLKGCERIQDDFGIDGFSWLIEKNTSDGYNAVRRHDISKSSQKISLIMLYMLKCAGIEHMLGEGTNFKPAELFNKIIKEEGITFK